MVAGALNPKPWIFLLLTSDLRSLISMSSYRWNTSDFAVGYDAAAEVIHPYYLAIQDEILRLLKSTLDSLSGSGGPPSEPTTPRLTPRNAPSLIVDLGGGSGRLIERILDQSPLAHGIVIDQ